MDNQLNAWQQQDLAKLFLEEVRGGIPLAAEQIDVLLRVVRHAIPRVDRLLDLGCGDGILGRTVMAEYPQAKGVFLDFSEHMIEAAKKKADIRRATFVVQDLATKTWTQSVGDHAPFDLVVSGLAIHHLPDERKRELYHEIFDLLKPGGLFLNLEHVAPRRHGRSKHLTTCLWIRSGRTIRNSAARRPEMRLPKSGITAPTNRRTSWLRLKCSASGSRRSVSETWTVSSSSLSWRCSAGESRSKVGRARGPFPSADLAQHLLGGCSQLANKGIDMVCHGDHKSG